MRAAERVLNAGLTVILGSSVVFIVAALATGRADTMVGWITLGTCLTGTAMLVGATVARLAGGQADDEARRRERAQAHQGQLTDKPGRVVSTRFAVTFFGGPTDSPQGRRQAVPLRDLSETPYVCVELDTGECLHYVRRGDGSQREFEYVGLCADVPGEHLGPTKPG